MKKIAIMLILFIIFLVTPAWARCGKCGGASGGGIGAGHRARPTKPMRDRTEAIRDRFDSLRDRRDARRHLRDRDALPDISSVDDTETTDSADIGDEAQGGGLGRTGLVPGDLSGREDATGDLTGYVGDKGDEIADYSLNYSAGSVPESTSIYFYSSDSAGIPLPDVSSTGSTGSTASPVGETAE